MKTGYTDKHGKPINVGDIVRWNPMSGAFGGANFYDHRVDVIDGEPCAIFIKGSHSATPLKWIGFSDGNSDTAKLTALEIVTIKEEPACTQD